MIEVFITCKKRYFFPDEVSEICEDISVSNFSRLLDFLFANGENACLLTGNEPLLHPQLNELLTTAQRKRAFIVLETAGLPTQRLNELIIRYKPAIRWKIYHPDFYAENEWEEILKSFFFITKQNKFLLETTFIIHNISLSYNSWFSVLEGNSSQKIYIEIPPQAFRVGEKIDREEMKRFASQIVQLVEEVSQRGITVTLGCVIPPCIFSDTELGFLAKMGALPKRCLPYLGILPNLNFYHCRILVQDAESNLSDFKNLTEVEDYFINRYGESQLRYYLFEECKKCPSRKVRVCMGGCLFLKRELGISIR
jgi:radical SAM protein with 4Fe4S-binding SPASM domain